MIEDVMPVDAEQTLTRRGFAKLAMAGVLVAGTASIVARQVTAREAEPGDDRGRHGRREDHHRHRRHGRDDHGHHNKGHR